MWIHIPYQSVADMGESNWDLEQLSQELESSATWKTKSLKAASWERVLKTESLTTLLSGLTLEPSMRNRLVERFISSLEGSPASPTALRERNEEPTTQENSQEKYSVLPTNLGDQLSFLRMFQELDGSTGTTSDHDYKRWDTELRKSSLQREKQGHHIKGNDYSSWPTPDTQNFRDGSKLRRGSYMNHAISLHHKVAYWSTPSARDYRGTVDPPGKKNTYKDPDMYLSIHRDQTTTKDGHTCSPTCLRLNQHFAEWLQGLPRGWVSSSAQLEMELFQLQQLELSFYLASVLNE